MRTLASNERGVGSRFGMLGVTLLLAAACGDRLLPEDLVDGGGAGGAGLTGEGAGDANEGAAGPQGSGGGAAGDAGGAGGAGAGGNGSGAGAGGSETGGAGGAGGSGGGQLVCEPEATASCYTGPAGTEGKGVCHRGQTTCSADGASWGACIGEVVPGEDLCSTPHLDENCDGLPAGCGQLESLRDLAWVSVGAFRYLDNGTIGVAGKATPFSGSPLFDPAFPQPEAMDAFYIANFSTTGELLHLVWMEDNSLNHPVSMAFDAWGGLYLMSANLEAWHKINGISFEQAATSMVEPAVLARVSPGGTLQWYKVFEGEFDVPDLEVDSAGNVLIVKSADGLRDFGAGPLTPGKDDIVLAKLDKHGNYLWADHYDYGPDDGSGSLSSSLDGDDNLILAYDWTGDYLRIDKRDPDGTLLWGHEIDFPAGRFRKYVVDAAPDGSFVLAGEFRGTVTGNGSIAPVASPPDDAIFPYAWAGIVMKFDPMGTLQWATPFATTGNPIKVEAVELDSSGSVHVGMRFHTDILIDGEWLETFAYRDRVLVELTPDGEVDWFTRWHSGTTFESDFQHFVMTPEGKLFFISIAHQGLYWNGEPAIDGNTMFLALLSH